MHQPNAKTGADGTSAPPVAPNRRNLPRKALNPPRVALFRPVDGTGASPPPWRHGERPFYVDVHDGSPDGLLLWTNREIPPGQHFHLFVFGFPGKRWGCFDCQVRWVKPDPKKSAYHLVGCTAAAADFHLPAAPADAPKPGPFPSDYEFFRTVPFLKAIHRDAVCPLLNIIRHQPVKAGETFITQGEDGDACFFVHAGTCRVVLEKQGERHVVGLVKEREFVGEMALLTGEPRSAHVEAVTDLKLWRIPSDVFEGMLQADPEVATFLTEIVAERFASRKLTADRRIGKYLITAILGRGAFAVVYTGYHADLNRPVAIKMLRHDMAINPEFLTNFRREAQTIANLNHENIVKVFDIEERFRTVFIIMEHLEGRTLRELLDAVGRLSVRDAIKVLVQICRGIRYAHEKDIVHQDIKPSNIFILPDGQVKILDFGLACSCGSENPLTGTPFYMSPEQVECLPVDERTDIFALGLTAFKMVSGRRPFDEEDPLAVMDHIVERDIPDPADFVPDLPAPLRDFILRACARDPKARYRSVGQALAEIAPLVRQMGLRLEHTELQKCKLSTLILMYREDQQIPLNRLLEDFSDKAKQIGVILRGADFKDV
jgi:CRP-like cAMP-binding protein